MGDGFMRVRNSKTSQCWVGGDFGRGGVSITANIGTDWLTNHKIGKLQRTVMKIGTTGTTMIIEGY